MSHTTEIKGHGRIFHNGDWSGNITFILNDDVGEPPVVPAEVVRAVARIMLADEIECAAAEMVERIRKGL